MLAPRAVAVIGATETPGRVGRVVFENLLDADRPAYPVNPGRAEVLGRPAFARVEDLPDGIDLAVIAVEAAQAVEAAERCGRRGIPAVAVIAGGFGETGAEGRELQERLGAVVRRHRMRLLGPNTLGVWVPAERLDTIFVEHERERLGDGGGIAFITQSGSVGIETLTWASAGGFGLRAFVGLGNKVDLDELDFLRHFGDDPATRCLMLYLEDFGRGRAFLEAAREVSRRKPIVVLRAGRTAAGAAAVGSHTGRLAGSDRVVGDAFRQYGILRAGDDEELCDAARTLAALPLPRGNRVALLSPAGGYGVIGADLVETTEPPGRLRMAAFSTATERRIRAAALPFASPHNPIDLTGSATDDQFPPALDALLADDGVDLVLLYAMFAPPGITERLLDWMADRLPRADKPVLVFLRGGRENAPYLRRLYASGVVAFTSLRRAVRAARFLVERAELLRAWEGAP